METQKKQKVPIPSEKHLQWHPAFYAGIQIELQDYADKLIFENEHQLGTKPMGIDVIIIKKQAEIPVHKNIGRIFRKYNIIEYKGPGDYLSIDDWYKVYGYCYFYKADTGTADSIKIDELTITLVCEHYPRKLFRHLTHVRKYQLIPREPGIYEIAGDAIPIQIIVTAQLSRKENLWLKSLTNHLQDVEDAKELLKSYNQNKENKLYESVIDIVLNANRKKFKEADTMCTTMLEILKEEFHEQIKGELDRAQKIGEANGIKIGEANGETKTLKRVNTLNTKLISLNRLEDIIKSSSDTKYQELLFQEFGL